MSDACCSCEDMRTIVKEEVKKLFDSEVIKLKTTSRKKRAPSAYNIFIGKCMKENNTPEIIIVPSSPDPDFDKVLFNYADVSLTSNN